MDTRLKFFDNRTGKPKEYLKIKARNGFIKYIPVTNEKIEKIQISDFKST